MPSLPLKNQSKSFSFAWVLILGLGLVVELVKNLFVKGL